MFDEEINIIRITKAMIIYKREKYLVWLNL
jgi:hypothetical protein